MTNIFKNFTVAAIAAASFMTVSHSANAMGINALADIDAGAKVEKVGFFKKNGKFTNRGVATIGVGAAIVGGLIASKVAKKKHYRPVHRPVYRPYRPHRPHVVYVRPTTKYVYKQRRTYRRPAIAFNQNVYNTQTWLNQVGYNAGVADGKLGARTRAAMTQFQAANGFPATGYMTPQQTAILAQQAAAALRPTYATRPVTAPAYVAPRQPATAAPFPGYAQPRQHVGYAQPQQPAARYVNPAQPQQPVYTQPVAPAPTAPAIQPIAAPAPNYTGSLQY